ncbi:hypothetical protein [Brevundimonas sp.]|uniref:hypothetical protein n=1 Tax=Brevundimonas sp. TaxID=1871086 RepID=UPI002C0C552F|nr:hypothetical protein [Brevundimonas sp.]HWQ86028.1 hypothetical protein [Brevundimonas sp.]
MSRLPGLAAALALFATPAAAEVVERSADHFVLRFELGLETTPEDIYGAVGDIGRWWDSAHTYSGDAANMTLPLEVGACFCEALADGKTFEHGRVVQADPGTGVLLEAPLGPLRGRATVAQWSIGWSGGGRGYALILTYVVRGAGLGAMADPVNGMMSVQFARLAHYVEYGEPPATSAVSGG